MPAGESLFVVGAFVVLGGFLESPPQKRVAPSLRWGEFGSPAQSTTAAAAVWRGGHLDACMAGFPASEFRLILPSEHWRLAALYQGT